MRDDWGEYFWRDVVQRDFGDLVIDLGLLEVVVDQGSKKVASRGEKGLE